MLHKDGAYRCILKGQIYVSKVAVKVAAHTRVFGADANTDWDELPQPYCSLTVFISYTLYTTYQMLTCCQSYL